MKRHYQILIPLLSLFLVRVDLTDLWRLRYECEVMKIMDGDTLELKVGTRLFRLRLEKVDAPEKKQPFLTRSGDAGKVSAACLKETLKGIKHPLILEMRQYDMYGRLLGDVSGLNFLLIQNGCSALYPYAEFTSRKEKATFLRAYHEARLHKKGLWKWGGYMTPKLWRSRHRSFKKRS
jgi:micrococcal nuclease